MKALIALVVFGFTHHLGAAEVEGLAGFGLCANDPVKLSQWYENFGFSFAMEGDGSLAALEGTKSQFHIGIYPVSAGDKYCPRKAEGSGISFKVDDFKGFLARLKTKGIVPTGTLIESYGSLAFFVDIEGNHISIFADPKSPPQL